MRSVPAGCDRTLISAVSDKCHSMSSSCVATWEALVRFPQAGRWFDASALRGRALLSCCSAECSTFPEAWPEW